MTDLVVDELLAALPKRTRSLTLGARLTVPDAPNPFVAPTFRVQRSHRDNVLEAEVIFIKASAAVGKSTIANYLSSTLGAPLLNLARIPVSTGSLKALLFDVTGAGNPLRAFHAGKLPIVIDALDEGRLLSGEQGFESFLETAGELLQEDRTVTDKAKLIFLGRYDSTEVAEIWISLAGKNIATCTLEVSFFEERAAWELIDAYARAASQPKSAYRQHPAPVRKLIEAYFDAIESALGLAKGELWSADSGKAFAGYAPVLSAMGSLLAQLDNFQDVTNKLKETGAVKEAWEVIDTVLMEITNREQKKLCEKLVGQTLSTLPAEAYDTQEQFTLLLQFVHGQALQGSGRIKLIGSDQAKYQAMVKAYIPEHPFIRNNDFGNAVLGSVVIAHGVLHDLLGSADPARTASYSRQPFLWRSTAKALADGERIKGKYLGFILNSFWNDPIQSNRRIEINSVSEGRANVSVFQNRRRQQTFGVEEPITLYAQIKDCEVDVVGDVKFVGDGPPSSTAFYARGHSTVICGNLEIQSASIRFEGDAWFESDNVSIPPLARLFVADDARIGWGGALAGKHPWTEFSTTLERPYDVVADDILSSLVAALANRTIVGGTIVLNEDLTAIENDPHMRWAIRQYSRELPMLIRILIDHGMASSEPLGASDQGKKVKVRPEFAWWDLFAVIENPDAVPKWKKFVMEAKSKIGNS